MTDTRTPPATQADDALVEELARAICSSKGLSPDALYQHNFEGEWPTDERNEYMDAFSGQLRVNLMHKAWRHSEKAARAILPILHRERAAAEQKAKEYWYRQGRDDAWQSGYEAGRAAAIRKVRELGCSVCNGDCAGANPPVSYCPMRELDAIERGQHGSKGDE